MTQAWKQKARTSDVFLHPTPTTFTLLPTHPVVIRVLSREILHQPVSFMNFLSSDVPLQWLQLRHPSRNCTWTICTLHKPNHTGVEVHLMNLIYRPRSLVIFQVGYFSCSHPIVRIDLCVAVAEVQHSRVSSCTALDTTELLLTVP